MISKAEFIRQAMAMHPPAVKPKKKRAPITFWGMVGFVLLCFFTGFMVYGVCFEEFPLEFILMFVGFWIFFFFYYRAFLHKIKIGRIPYQLPRLPWMASVGVFGVSLLLPLIGWYWIDSVYAFSSLVSSLVWFIVLPYGWLACLYFFILPMMNVILQKRYINIPFYKVLALLGISFYITPDQEGKNFKIYVNGRSVLLNVLKEYVSLTIPDVQWKKVSAEQKEKILTFFQSSTGQILADYLFPSKVSNDEPEQNDEFSGFFRTEPLGRFLRMCYHFLFAPEKTENIRRRMCDIFIYPKRNWTISFFRGEYFYPTPEDLPVIYEDVAAFYQTIEEITHG